MIAIDQMTDEDFESHAFKILERELGLGGLARFLRINRASTGDYTQDRREWLKDATIRDIMAEANAPGHGS